MVVTSQIDGIHWLPVAGGALQVLHFNVQIDNNNKMISLTLINTILLLCIGQYYKMQKTKYSTIDLHNIKQDVYLGFLAEQSFEPTVEDFDLSYFGGQPIWLNLPAESLQKCTPCNNQLTFLGQVYCPFNADRCYHRILYLLFCDQCLRQFKCIRQQATKELKLANKLKANVKIIGQAKQIENQPYNRNQLTKLMNKLKTQIEQQQIIEQAESEEQDEREIMSEANQQALQQFNKYEEDKQKGKNGFVQPKQSMAQNAKNEKQEDKDVIFETYKKVIMQLNNPSMLYTDVPVLYNRRPLNPQHICKQCGSKLGLQMQITQRILSMSSNPQSKLLLMDWGSLFIYTCSASCSESQQECIVVQYQIDAINDEDIKKLKKSKKNKKNKKKKQKSKDKQQKQGEKSIEQNKSQSQKQQQIQTSKENKKGKMEQKQAKRQQGDWD